MHGLLGDAAKATTPGDRTGGAQCIDPVILRLVDDIRGRIVVDSVRLLVSVRMRFTRVAVGGMDGLDWMILDEIISTTTFESLSHHPPDFSFFASTLIILFPLLTFVLSHFGIVIGKSRSAQFLLVTLILASTFLQSGQLCTLI